MNDVFLNLEFQKENMQRTINHDFKPRICEICEKMHENRIKFRKSSSKWKHVCSATCLVRHPWARNPNVIIKGLTPPERTKFFNEINNTREKKNENPVVIEAEYWKGEKEGSDNEQ